MNKQILPPGFSGVHVTQSLVLCVYFVDRCFVLLYFFFWLLCCLFFFDLRILITSLWYLQTLLTRLVIITLDILTYSLSDLLKDHNLHVQARENYDITSLYSDLGLLNKHGLSDGCWGGRNKQNLFDIPPHYRRIGDYIERVRIIRNEIQHSKCASMSDSRYNYNVPTFLLHVLSKIACYDFKITTSLLVKIMLKELKFELWLVHAVI